MFISEEQREGRRGPSSNLTPPSQNVRRRGLTLTCTPQSRIVCDREVCHVTTTPPLHEMRDGGVCYVTPTPLARNDARWRGTSAFFIFFVHTDYHIYTFLGAHVQHTRHCPSARTFNRLPPPCYHIATRDSSGQSARASGGPWCLSPQICSYLS